MRPAAFLLLLLAVLAGCDGPAATETRTNEERIGALGLHREPLPDADNPILSLKEPLESFLKATRDDFHTEADLPTFLDFQVGPETRKRCWELQQILRETIDRGPGRLPEIDADSFNVYFLIQARRANGALAAKSLADDNPSGAAFHLAFTFKVADYIIASEPTMLPYVFAVHLKQQTFDDLAALYRAAPNPELLSQITTICENSRFKGSDLESVLRNEARFSIATYDEFPEWVRKQHKEFGSLFQSFYESPLGDCSLADLMALKHDPTAAVSMALDEIEESLRWLETNTPLSMGPTALLNPPKPKPLTYYQSAPNGLTEIFRDCSMSGPHLSALVTHQILDAQIETALAWLRAEADGITVSSLDVLVPKYLDRIPADPCDGKPLRCIPAKRLTYSVGTDLRDNNGRSAFDPDATETDAMDRVLSLPEITP